MAWGPAAAIISTLSIGIIGIFVGSAILFATLPTMLVVCIVWLGAIIVINSRGDSSDKSGEI